MLVQRQAKVSLDCFSVAHDTDTRLCYLNGTANVVHLVDMGYVLTLHFTLSWCECQKGDLHSKPLALLVRQETTFCLVLQRKEWKVNIGDGCAKFIMLLKCGQEEKTTPQPYQFRASLRQKHRCFENLFMPT